MSGIDKLARNAAENPQEYLGELMEKMEAYVKKAASKYPDEYEDMVSVGNIAVMECLEAGWKDNFHLYAFRAASNAMIDETRKEKLDDIANPDRIAVTGGDSVEVDDITSLLSGFDQQVLAEKVDGATLQEIAERLECTVWAIRSSLERIKRHLEEHLD